MQDREALRIGCVKYLNARPLIHGWAGNVQFDSPSALCARLSRDELDVALVSSVEFLRNPTYQIVDGVSIASDGPVYSVIVAHDRDIAGVKEIELDPASETSVALLRYLLSNRGLTPSLVARSTSLGAQLLIGDQAIRIREQRPDLMFWDLGAEWKQISSLPFVYALWLIRPEVKDADSIARRLRELRDRNVANLDEVISTQTEFNPQFCDRYYCENVRFTFGDAEKKGLLKFAAECKNLDLIPNRDIALNLV